MTGPEPPLHDQAKFDSLCVGIDDYETLPELTPGPADGAPWRTDEDRLELLDEEILAGLVSP
jgi:hypothetical protein